MCQLNAVKFFRLSSCYYSVTSQTSYDPQNSALIGWNDALEEFDSEKNKNSRKFLVKNSSVKPCKHGWISGLRQFYDRFVDEGGGPVRFDQRHDSAGWVGFEWSGQAKNCLTRRNFPVQIELRNIFWIFLVICFVTFHESFVWSHIFTFFVSNASL